MEHLNTLMNFLTANGSDIVNALLSIVGGFAVLAKFTPTQTDDKVLQKILDLIHLGALNLKKS